MSYLSRSVRELWIGPAEQQSRLRALAIQRALDQTAKHMRKLGRLQRLSAVTGRMVNDARDPVSYRGRGG